MSRKLPSKFVLFLMLLASTGIHAQEISSLTLINAQTDTEIGLLTDGAMYPFSELSTNQLSVRADVSGTIGSVVFALDGQEVQTENKAPYALLGNSGKDYKPWAPEPGTYVISVSAFSSSDGGGSLLNEYSLSVTFVEEAAVDQGPDVLSLILVNADTGQDIGQISQGSSFDLGEIGTSNLSVRAEVGPNTESVVFGYQGNANYSLENLPVYALAGNSGNTYTPWTPDLGQNSLTATAYSENQGAGTAGEPLSVNFEVTEGASGGGGNDLPALIRINSGGDAMSFGDLVFVADDYFAGEGKSYTNNKIADIAGTDQDDLYKTERSTNANLQSFSYNIPVTNGDYELNLHFAEIYFGATGGGPGGPGKRVFNVSIEGENVLADFDINTAVGPMTAVIKSFSAKVSDGELNLLFDASVNQPKVSAIEIFGEGSIVSPPDGGECDWDALASSTLSKVEAQSIKLNDKLYVLAGFLGGLKITPTTEIYDPATDQWTSGAPMPTPVTHMGAVGVGDEIWILAGFEGNHPGVATNKVQIYNTVTDSWSEGPALPNPRGSGAAAYNEGKIHFFGGLLPDRRTDVGEHFILDVDDIAAGWKEAADMPDPRNHLSGAAVNGKVYAIGGQFGHDGGVQDQNFLDEYDPTNNTWTRKQGLPSARSHFEPGTMVHNDKIIIVGGRRGGFFFDDVTEYDPATDSWSERCELPTTLLAPAAKVFGDRLIVANGGEGGTCCPKNNTISIGIEPEEETDPELRVLIYHETNGFRHGSISAGIEMIEGFGDDLDWSVDSSQTSNVFNTSNLSDYDVVVWLNTSGNGLLSEAEQSAFEDFIGTGGGFVGVHAATDTYRDGSWPWYNDLVGAIIQVNPNHTANNTNATMDVVGDHPAVAHLGDTWNKSEEYYYWAQNGGYLFEGNINLLNVRSTGANSYDASRPVTWYKNYAGGRSFYTALGHNSSDYSSNSNFRTMMREAIIWAANGNGQNLVAAKAVWAEKAVQPVINGIIVYPNPTTERLYVVAKDDSQAYIIEGTEATLRGMDGQLILSKTLDGTNNQIEVGNLPSGYYVLSLDGAGQESERLIFVQ